MARFFSDQDPQFEDAVLQATSRGSSLASNLEFEHELSKPTSDRNMDRLAELALQSAILGDNSALEYAVREQWNPLPLRRIHIVVALTIPIRDIFVRREAAINAGMRPPRPRGFAERSPVDP